MSSLFMGKVLIRNNSDGDEVDTEQELSLRLDNRVLLLYFGAGECPRCQAFAPILKDFFVKLTDEFYVNRSSQIALVYISQDETEDQQDSFLRDMPRKWLFLPFQDELKRDLERMFAVDHVPMVVVLKPSGEVVTRDAVDEIGRLGPACFWNWQEASEIIDRNFLAAEDFDDLAPRSLTDPIRRLKYKIEKETSKSRTSQDGPQCPCLPSAPLKLSKNAEVSLPEMPYRLEAS
ncbi:nucleoredoxin-like protein 1 isoform X2 [Petaurus breviceps papuanus]|uniref:nucleoredoxin-like protein 1 isoform X2 n=1 Tax=Petaurus breviceps papuanus TaxID=3040969 RepID=UPI0036DF45AB